ncbi:MAG: TIGR02757 family protein [Chitinophagales bacterium]
MLSQKELKTLLDQQAALFEQPGFIISDPISVPRKFSKLQDIEIAGLFAAVFAWGQRKTIISKANELMLRMDNSPYEFVLQHEEQDLKKLLGFKHRTFNDTDLLYFVHFLKHYYATHKSLETAFLPEKNEQDLEEALCRFRKRFFALEAAPERTKKHIASPLRNSSCKRLNMYLRWMVRKNESGVDFGLWKSIKSSQLFCPLDVHVERVALELGLLKKAGSNWKAVKELTSKLRKFDPEDPVKYDFALFGMGVLTRVR